MEAKEHTYYQTLYELAKVINSSLEPVTVLGNIAEQAAKAMDCKACTIRLLDRLGESLLAGASYGLSRGYLRKGKVLVSKSGLDQEILKGKVIHIRDVNTDPRFQYPQEAHSEGIASILSVPLTVGSKVIGVMRVYSQVLRDFSKGEVDFLSIIANLSAIAIENARLHQALKSDYELLTAYEYSTYED